MFLRRLFLDSQHYKARSLSVFSYCFLPERTGSQRTTKISAPVSGCALPGAGHPLVVTVSRVPEKGRGPCCHLNFFLTNLTWKPLLRACSPWAVIYASSPLSLRQSSLATVVPGPEFLLAALLRVLGGWERSNFL